MKKTTLVAGLLLCSQLIYSQEAILGSGGDAAGAGGSSSYSVGQLVYTTITGDGTVAQGVQQSIELFTLSNPELTTVKLSAVTYPNPTSDYVVLAIRDINLSDLSYALYDIQGRTVLKGLVSEETTQITMQDLEVATYILKLNQNNKELKSFKIIKK
ncbi:T9SS type A sorting domain-containing protein [Olleya sp. Bg11-27]|uniref:T9SS type A sorting domain-containing protein n=1 Tax=Olleya sp. Bg11-27 TaxID=2058135 RepID=UPI000C315C37|nr:T9SS type A sorting domain-containing protein [Olleya sp. Bg11-27]AUC75683.1 hypothetical protein CW732_08355 [Olleya sp. Bg11-27]